jgi:chemotaxis protein methyltransferase CheR
VLGTDLNPDFLAAERDAAYGEWSFRGCEARLREHFTLRGKQWHLDPRVRDLVTFAPLNLATDDYPTNVDVIFCRNVLIYFDAQTRRRVLTRLRDSLAPEGWLITGHADLGGDDIAGLQPRLGAESFAWQRSEVQTETAPCTTPSPPPVAIRRPPPPRRVPRREPDARSLFETAARLIDRGEDEAAAETLRRSLYLDPRQPAAHYLAGLIAGRRGSRRNAARHFRAAIVTLSTLADDVVLDGTEGITAGRLRQTLDALLRESSEVMHA